jgi:Ca2+-binding RTX toxin-like protein
MRIQGRKTRRVVVAIFVVLTAGCSAGAPATKQYEADRVGVPAERASAPRATIAKQPARRTAPAAAETNQDDEHGPRRAPQPKPGAALPRARTETTKGPAGMSSYRPTSAAPVTPTVHSDTNAIMEGPADGGATAQKLTTPGAMNVFVGAGASTATVAGGAVIIYGNSATNDFRVWISKKFDSETGAPTGEVGIAVRDTLGRMAPSAGCSQHTPAHDVNGNPIYDPQALWCNYQNYVIVNGGPGDDGYRFVTSSIFQTPFTIPAEVHGEDGNDVIIGGQNAPVAMDGGPGSDKMYGSPFGDYMTDPDVAEMHGYGGQDHFNGGQFVTVDYSDSGFNGVNVVVGGGFVSGDADAIDPCMGRIVGTYANDNLIGDDCANAIDGREGDDTIDGGRGQDFLDGGVGYNTVNYLSIPEGVQVSLDWTQPQTQFDRLLNISKVVGSRGNDTIYGTAGGDYLVGASGSDTIYGLGGNDQIWGDVDSGGVLSPGPDTLYGGDGNDVLAGGDGNDTLNGGNNGDDLYGEGGSNTIRGDAGDDYLGGGDLVDYMDGGTGYDEIWGSAGDDQIWGGDEDDVVQSGPGNDTASGGNGNDQLYGGSAGADWLYGDAGWDTLWGGSENDNLYGGSEDDTLMGEAGADALNGDDGIDRLFGGTENDTLRGGNGIDDLYGEDGNDNLYGDANNDTMYWEPGADLYDGGAGDDSLDYTTSPAPVTVTVDGINDDGNFDAGEHDNVIPDPGTGLDELVGSRFDDDLEGNNRRNWLAGGLGDDLLTGAGGADILEGDGGTDQARFDWATTPIVAVIGGTGASTGGTTIMPDVEGVFGGSGDDRIVGDDHDNTLIGNLGTDTIYGNGGNDELYGYFNTDWGAPFVESDQGVFGRNLAQASFVDNDTIYGGLGADTVDGGPGDDRLYGEGDKDDLRGGAGQDYLVGADPATIEDNINDSINALDGYWTAGADSLSTAYHQNPFPDTVVCADNVVWSDEVKVDGADLTNRCIHATRYDNSWTGAWNEATDIPIFDVPSGFSRWDILRDAAVRQLGMERNPSGEWDWLGFAQDLGGGDEDEADFYEEALKKPKVKVKRRADRRVEISDLMFPLHPTAGCVQGVTQHTLVCDNIDTIRLNTGPGDDEVTLADIGGTVNLGDGNDTVRTDSGAVAIDGGNGTNTINYNRAAGTSVSVTLDGVANDGAAGDNANITKFQRIIGGPEDDTFDGTTASEYFDGGGGTNTISYARRTSSQPVTVILPGTGGATTGNGIGGENDNLTNFTVAYGGAGGDRLNGGPLNDVLRGNGGNDILDGKAGAKTADYGDKTVGIAVTLGEGTTNGSARIGTETDTLMPTFRDVNGGQNSDQLTGNSLFNILRGGNGNDTLTGGGFDDRLYGEAGDDTLDGQAGGDIMDGGVGNDTFTYSTRTASVRVSVNSGADDGESGEGDLVVTGPANTGTDRIIGGSGNDVLIGDASPQQLRGNPGDDYFEGRGGNDSFYGSSGFDTVVYNTTANLSLRIGAASSGGIATNNLINTDVEQVVGGSGNDNFRGNWQSQKFDGGAGIDTVDYVDHTAAQPVTVKLADGDAVSTGNGWTAAFENDQLVRIEGITGGAGNDTITGNAAANTLSGYQGNDKVYGGGGNDTVNGNDGSDILHGDDGDDTFNWEPSNDLYDGDAGNDTIWYTASPYPVTVNQNPTPGVPCASGATINGVSEGDCVLFTVENVIGSLTARTVIVGMTNPADHVTGTNNLYWAPSNAGNWIDGGGGDDLILGGGGNDTLIGGPGNDNISGGDGSDGLWGDAASGSINGQAVTVMPSGGYGRNTLNGGNGDDLLHGANGLLDSITCGAGFDIVVQDLVIADTFRLTSQGGDCETARRNGAP